MRIEWSLDLPAPCGYLRNPHHMARTWMHEHHDEFVRCGTSEQLNVHHENLISRSTASQTRFAVPRQSVHNAAAWFIQATLFARSCTQEKLQLSQSDWMQVLPRQISLRVLQLQTLQGHACFLLSVHPDANQRVFVALLFRRDWCRFAHFCGLWSATHLAQPHAQQIQTCAWRRGRPRERTYHPLA